MTNKELQELLDEYGDHLEVFVEFDEHEYVVIGADTVEVDGELRLEIELDVAP